MTPQEFIQRWHNVKLTERSASQQHFLDLCKLVGHPTPAEIDKTGETFTFERGVAKGGNGLTADGNGWADVWKKGAFAWEYKGPHKDLAKAYGQLQQYREDLENPPLLVVSDMDRIIIHTNFTATPVEVHKIPLIEIGTPENLEKLRALFYDPEKLRPGLTSERITAKAAGRLAELAQSLRNRDYDAHEVARYLDRIVFCLFAEDIALLPEKLFTRLLEKTYETPHRFTKYAHDLFNAMATGGDFNLEDIRHFNGNLFAECTVLDLTTDELAMLYEASRLDWSAIDPSIFGTLFERGMDPSKRSQLGAHYTSRKDIETLIEPVVMLPLRRDWYEARVSVEHLLATGRKPPKKFFDHARKMAEDQTLNHQRAGAENFSLPSDFPKPKKLSERSLRRVRHEAGTILTRFHHQLARTKVLDPACGSGNFLYVTLQKLKDLEKEVIVYAQDKLNESFLPQVGPWQLYGIELNPYAFDLAQMTVWIGYLQWTRANGFGITQDPILRPMKKNFQCKDAILEWKQPHEKESEEGVGVGRLATTPQMDEHGSTEPSGSERSPESQSIAAKPKEPDWPRVHFIVGNPPFLGGKFLRREFNDEYVEALFDLWSVLIPKEADLCCYWFERARQHIAEGKARRAGLLATQGIRGRTNRKVLERIKNTGDLFFAESDRPWVLEGANVHVSMVGFDNGTDNTKVLDGNVVKAVNGNLTSDSDITQASVLFENKVFCFRPTEKGGQFERYLKHVKAWLVEPNPNGRPTSDVLRPWVNGTNLVKERKHQWIIDFFGINDEDVASCYELPYKFLYANVKEHRRKNRDKRLNNYWWLHRRSGEDMRQAVHTLPRMICTPRVSKHRLFVWIPSVCLPDTATYVFARSDDYFFGLLHSRLHEIWARAQGTQLRERESGFRYTPTSCFETFPFPWPPGKEPQKDELVQTIGKAAQTLCELRDNWLNPPEWTTTEVLEFPGTVGGPWDRYIEKDEHGNVKTDTVNVPGGETIRVGKVKYPRTVPKDETCAKKLKKRTLTNLYNERPAWLDNAHKTLDEAVCNAYVATTNDNTWTKDMPEDQILEKLLKLNLERDANS